MSFTCPKCLKSLSSNQKLKQHLRKKTPCNFECPRCGHRAINSSHYEGHLAAGSCEQAMQKQIENVLVPIKQTNVESLKPILKKSNRVESLNPIPIQDFNLAILKDLGLGVDLNDYDIERYVRQTEKGKEEVATLINHKQNGDLQFDQVTKVNIEIEKHETIILKKRVKKARDALTNNMLFGAMISMVPAEIEMDQLNRMASDMMYDVLHHEDPRLHNVCLSDISRGTVRVYSRVSESEECVWATHTKDIAVKVLNEHAKNLFSFLLEAGTQSLVSAVWKSIAEL